LQEELQRVVEGAASPDDPVLAGGLCLLRRSLELEVVSVEAAGEESGTLLALSVALLGALVNQETDAQIQASLELALQHANVARRASIAPLTGRVN
jgi:hypothetical protein